MKKIKLKKKNLFIFIFLVILVLLFIYFIFIRTHSYNFQYKVSDFNIAEEYDKKYNSYSFTTKYKNKTYLFQKNNKFLHTKKLITNIEVFENENYSCIIFKSSKLDTYPICYNNKGELVAYYLLNLENFSTMTYEKTNITNDKIKINALLNNKIYIWNYTGYYYIKNNKINKINFLENENYKNKNTFQIENYLLTPDYDQENSYNRIYLINMKTGKLTKWDLGINIDYNSYYLGKYKDCGYIVDRKNKLEYKICPKNKKIDQVQGIYINNGKLENISLNKLSNIDYHFTEDTLNDYIIKNNKLYSKTKNLSSLTLLSKKEIDLIIKRAVDDVYYLSKGNLYLSNLKYGEVHLIENSEWNFNKENQIYIY